MAATTILNLFLVLLWSHDLFPVVAVPDFTNVPQLVAELLHFVEKFSRMAGTILYFVRIKCDDAAVSRKPFSVVANMCS